MTLRETMTYTATATAMMAIAVGASFYALMIF